MADGRVVEEGPPAQVLTAPQHPATRQLLSQKKAWSLIAASIRVESHRRVRACRWTPTSAWVRSEIIRLLGAGGMGEVYRARDVRLDRDVALKVLPAETLADETARARLLHEARLASKLNHPHVCTIHEVGEDEGQALRRHGAGRRRDL